MYNLYQKVAVTSVCTALGFALGANKEVKAATFTLTSTNNFYLYDINKDGVVDGGNSQNSPLPVGLNLERENDGSYTQTEYRAFYEFNIANLSLPYNTVIRSVILQTRVLEVEWYGPYFEFAAYGINEPLNNISVFDAGEYLDNEYLQRDRVANFSVLPFIAQRIRNNEAFAGFGIRNFQLEHYGDDDGYMILDRNARLIIETEPVPEPTTIFGSALALCLGGWLKRKKPTLQNKAKSQT
jgi:hypothetical protein